MKKHFKTLLEIDLEIREANINGVILSDKATGYAVVQIFNQAGADGKPQYDSLEIANKLISLLQLLKALNNETNNPHLR